MTTSRPDDDRLLAAWLADGIDTAPPRVVRSALEQVARTRQRGELALVRRVYGLDAIAPMHKRSPLRFALLGAAGAVAVIAIGTAIALSLRMEAQPAGPPPLPRAAQLVADLPSPSGTRAHVTGDGLDAFSLLAARSRVGGFNDPSLRTSAESASTVIFDALGTSDGREYAATALVFHSADEATSAMRVIRSGLRLETGQWAQGNSPFTDEHVPAVRDEGFERSGTYWAFGGTSAGASSRVGHMNVWRTGDVVFVAMGVDWDTPGTPEYQSTIEEGVIALSDAMAARAR